MTNIQSLYNTYLNSCNLIYYFDETTPFFKNSKYIDILNYQLNNPVNFCKIYYDIITYFFEVDKNIKLVYEDEYLKEGVEGYIKMSYSAVIDKEIEINTIEQTIKNHIPKEIQNIITDTSINNFITTYSTSKVKHSETFQIIFKTNTNDIISNLTNLLLYNIYLHDDFFYKTNEKGEQIYTSYYKIYDYITNYNNIILSIYYPDPEHWCSMYIQKTPDQTINIYLIDTSDPTIKLSNIHDINEFIFRYYLYLIDDPMNRYPPNIKPSTSHEREFIEGIFEFTTKIDNLPQFFKTSQGDTNLCYYFSVLYATSLFLYFNKENIQITNCFYNNHTLQKGKNIKLNTLKDYFEENSYSSKLKILLDYYTYLLYIKRYNYEYIKKISDKSYITYFELIDNVLNKQYKLYLKFYNKYNDKLKDKFILTSPNNYLFELNNIKNDIIDNFIKIYNNKQISININEYQLNNTYFLNDLTEYDNINKEYSLIQYYDIMKQNIQNIINNFDNNTLLTDNKIFFDNSQYTNKSLNADIPFIYLYEQFCDMIIMKNVKGYVIHKIENPDKTVEIKETELLFDDIINNIFNEYGIKKDTIYENIITNLESINEDNFLKSIKKKYMTNQIY